MSTFTPAELEYLAGQPLGRLATVDAAGDPHVVPVSFRYDAELDVVDVAGHAMAASKKFRDVRATGRAALVVDDVVPPWQPRGVEIRGPAETVLVHDPGGTATDVIRLSPRRVIGWGLDTHPYVRNARTVHRPG